MIWREKEFLEKYKGLRHNSDNDSYSALEGTLKNGLPMLAVINMDLLKWDSKASHPWIAVLEIRIDGKNHNGMPDNFKYELLTEIEEKIVEELKDPTGYLNVGRQTADSVREIYFSCIDFRKPSRVMLDVIEIYEGKAAINFDIYKDKYWQSFSRFMPNNYL